jgi:cytochrome c biogenesis protein CcdA
MLLLIGFAFLAGIITILSPCILPLLPIVLSGSAGGGKRRPLGIVSGFIVSFTVFTLSLSALIRLLGISPNILRTAAVIMLFVFGLVITVPFFRDRFELLASRLTNAFNSSRGRSRGSRKKGYADNPSDDGSRSAEVVDGKKQKRGFGGGLWIGISLGIVWTPCVGPIMASVITIASIGAVSAGSVFITLAYSLGTALPMLAIMYGGRRLLLRFSRSRKKTIRLQQVFGVLIIITAIGIYFDIDRKIQSAFLDSFPGYADFITRIEDNSAVDEALEEVEEKRGSGGSAAD